MLTVGLTGSTGSGKGYISDIMKKVGIPCLDTDQVCRDVYRKGEPCYGDLVSYFGDGILKDDGEIDRRALFNVAFPDKDKYEKLNSIAFYHIMKVTERWLSERRAAGDEFLTSNLANAFVEAPLAALVRQFPLMKANDVSGFLYWNFICGYGDSNPWERLAASGENGGAHMLYPYTTGPVETIRWRAMGWGIELFDLITLMDAKPLSAAVEERRAAVRARIRAADGGIDLRNAVELESLRSEILDIMTEKP
jgi:hypothetical protein